MISKLQRTLSLFLVCGAMSSSALADSNPTKNYDCGVVEGLISASKVLWARGTIQGNSFVYKNVIETKYREGDVMKDELRAAAKRVSKLSISKVLEDVANRINSVEDDFYGDVYVLNRKVDELDRTFKDASKSLQTLSEFICEK